MLLDLINLSVSDWFSAHYLFQYFYENAGYWLVFWFMVIESSFLPFPSEVVVPPAAYIAVQRGDMNIFLIVLVATAGAVVGALVNYFLSLWLGRPIVYAFANSRLGHACLIDQAKVEKAEKYFDEHGAVSTFIGRLIPAVRQLISIPAGLSRMNLGTFTIFTALGAGVWNCILAGLGYWLGKSVPSDALFATIEKYNGYFTIGGIVLLVLCVIYLLWNAFRTKKGGAV
ncbi:MAG: DedA family protein [[Clostridium] fimetarium]|nr:DedA family protein [Alistipes timonensis]MCM1406736.1 DedA family protein [[Clostridium] fimetarium]